MHIIIPLGNGSRFGDLELRIALRSIERNAIGAGPVTVITDRTIGWLRNVDILSVPDRWPNCKDANLFDKILAFCRRPDAPGRFLFWSDDQVLLHPFEIDRTEVSYNPRDAAAFQTVRTRWARRMVRTMLATGRTAYNYDTHIPQPHNTADVLRVMDGVEYAANGGFCVNTYLYGRSGIDPDVEQSRIKLTVESPADLSLPWDRRWLGYNDVAFAAGLHSRLLERFPEKSNFEKD